MHACTLKCPNKTSDIIVVHFFIIHSRYSKQSHFALHPWHSHEPARSLLSGVSLQGTSAPALPTQGGKLNFLQGNLAVAEVIAGSTTYFLHTDFPQESVLEMYTLPYTIEAPVESPSCCKLAPNLIAYSCHTHKMLARLANWSRETQSEQPQD